MRWRAKRVPGAPVLPVPIVPLTDNGGYIYSPSAVQAAVAAVLRNGYMTHKGTPEEALLAMDLSSERVRYALFLLQGVQHGQSLNALLGYLFEAGLDALGLDQYTQPFRDRFPVVGAKLTPSARRLSRSSPRTWWMAWPCVRLGTPGISGPGRTGAPACHAPGADQADVIACSKPSTITRPLGDLSMAETVFQIIRGNFGRVPAG